jgi:hypothetical protein
MTSILHSTQVEQDTTTQQTDRDIRMQQAAQRRQMDDLLTEAPGGRLWESPSSSTRTCSASEEPTGEGAA